MNSVAPRRALLTACADRYRSPLEVTASAWLKPIVDGAPRPLKRISAGSARYGYFLVGGSHRVVAVEAAGGLDLPIGITVPPLIVSDLNTSAKLFIGDGRVDYDGCRLRIRRFRDDRPVIPSLAASLAFAAREMRRILDGHERPHASGIVERRVDVFARSLRRWPRADLCVAVESMVGLGTGSTPSGDDVIAGATATLCAMGRGRGAIAKWSRDVHRELCGALDGKTESTTPLSAELLACAEHGHMLPRLASCIVLAMRGSCIRRAMDEMLRVGHDSGYYLATGAAAALRAAASLPRRENQDA